GDAAGAGGDEVREERLHAVHHAPEVDVDHAGDVLDVAALHGADEADARVVEQVVDHAVALDHGIGEPPHLLVLRDVDDLGQHLGALHPAARGGLGQSGGVDIAQRELRAAPGEFDGEFAAHAGRGAGDDGDVPPVVL